MRVGTESSIQCTLLEWNCDERVFHLPRSSFTPCTKSSTFKLELRLQLSRFNKWRERRRKLFRDLSWSSLVHPFSNISLWSSPTSLLSQYHCTTTPQGLYAEDLFREIFHLSLLAWNTSEIIMPAKYSHAYGQCLPRCQPPRCETRGQVLTSWTNLQ